MRSAARPLMIETVEAYLGNGLEINHIIEVSFEDFPEFIDALGGIDVKLSNCLKSNSFGGRRVRLAKGEHHLDGKQRTRSSPACARTSALPARTTAAAPRASSRS